MLGLSAQMLGLFGQNGGLNFVNLRVLEPSWQTLMSAFNVRTSFFTTPIGIPLGEDAKTQRYTKICQSIQCSETFVILRVLKSLAIFKTRFYHGLLYVSIDLLSIGLYSDNTFSVLPPITGRSLRSGRKTRPPVEMTSPLVG